MVLGDPTTSTTFSQRSPYAANPLRTRTDLAAFAAGMLDALAPHTSPLGSRIHLGHTGTHFDEHAAQLEGFSRPLWALAALVAGGHAFPRAEVWARGLAAGTDPEGEEFWGDMRDKDQRMVECSAIGFALSIAGDKLWTPLSEKEKDNLGRWLNVMNTKEMPNTNWLWFRVFANLGLTKVGSQYGDAARIKKDLDHLDTFYVGDGWSRDGPPGVLQLDYYSGSFAIQFAQLAYSKLAQGSDPKRCEEYRNRAKAFALDFVRYFDEEGRAIPFGRSIVYRFAMGSFWGALAFADVELPAPLSWGVVKGLLLRHVRFWARQPGAFFPDGTLTLGYGYPNLNITENYNSPGSSYWCCKAFAPAALPETHPFWAAAEEPYPAALVGTVRVMPRPLHIATNLAGHTYLLSSGQQCSYPVKQSAAKYGKFGYSAAFGYSVPTGDLTLEEHAGDSALLLSADAGETWKARRVTEEARIEGPGGAGGVWLRSTWRPWPGVLLETFLVPPAPATPAWHLRVHRLVVPTALAGGVRSAEGAWAVHAQGADGRHLAPVGTEAEGTFGTWEAPGAARAASKAGVSGLRALGPTARELKGYAMRSDPNSNLVVSRAIIPTLLGEHVSGSETWLVTAVFGLAGHGETGAQEGWMREWEKRPEGIPAEIAALIK